MLNQRQQAANKTLVLSQSGQSLTSVSESFSSFTPNVSKDDGQTHETRWQHLPAVPGHKWKSRCYHFSNVKKIRNQKR